MIAAAAVTLLASYCKYCTESLVAVKQYQITVGEWRPLRMAINSRIEPKCCIRVVLEQKSGDPQDLLGIISIALL